MTINPKPGTFTIGEGGDSRAPTPRIRALLVATFNANAPRQTAHGRPCKSPKLGFNNKGIDTVIDGKWWGELTFTY